MEVFLDMDGVFVDFDEGVRQRYNAHWWYPTEWAIPYKKLGTTFDKFWEDLNDEYFWAYLPWKDDGKRIVSLVEPFKPTILTASLLPQASAGKLQWLSREYPDTMNDKRVLIANGHTAKAAVAGPGKILIDDKNENVDEWVAAGGYGILMPRPWNRLAGNPFPLDYLRAMLAFAMTEVE
jgi:hypothetical protein